MNEFKACKDVDGFVSLAKSKGYDISADDIKAAQGTSELSDDALDKASGGGRAFMFNPRNTL